MEARWRARGSGPVALLGGGLAVAAPRRGGEAAVTRLGEGSRAPCRPVVAPGGRPRDLADR
jgi:hypothetical protein